MTKNGIAASHEDSVHENKILQPGALFFMFQSQLSSMLQ